MKLIGIYYKRAGGVLCGFVSSDLGTIDDLKARANPDECVVIVAPSVDLNALVSSLGLVGQM